jgi:hypothetical protein
MNVNRTAFSMAPVTDVAWLSASEVVTNARTHKMRIVARPTTVMTLQMYALEPVPGTLPIEQSIGIGGSPESALAVN